MTHNSDIREAIMEGAGVELVPYPLGGYYARVGGLMRTIEGRTASEVFLKIADLLLPSDGLERIQ